ncbi:MAG TPA: DUF3592 domain-containing protein [Chitinophagaceae bacterium]|nr:DUF3592 domain-containing protein [Chitinophagaceae bacterium]
MNLAELIPIIVPLILGAGLLLVTLRQYQKKKRLAATGVETDGVVAEWVRGDGTNKSLYPVIKFKTFNGTWIQERYDTPASLMFKTGQKVILRYNPDDPTEFTVETRFDIHRLVLIILAIGGTALLYEGLYKAFKCLQTP